MSQLDLFSESTPPTWPDWWLGIEALRKAGGRPLVQLTDPVIDAAGKAHVETLVVEAPARVHAEVKLMEFRGVWAWGHSCVLQNHGLSQSWPRPWREQPLVVLTRGEAVTRARAAIEAERLTALGDPSEGRGQAGGVPGEGFGIAPPRVEPLWSTAHGVDQAELEFKPAPVAPSVGEAILRENIRAIRRQVVDGARPGSGKALATIWNRTVREVADKDLDHMGMDELTAVWVKVREAFRGRW